MNNIEIQSILKKFRVSDKFFKGVYSSDNIPIFNTYPHAIIANTDKKDRPGRHWVAFFITSPKSIEYFDPLGNKPNNDINTYLSNFKNIKVNYMKIQAPLSNVCGLYCIMFVLCRILGKDYNATRSLLKSIEQPFHKYYAIL